MEVYSQKWGQCQCYKSTTQKMYFRFMDQMKFYKVATDDVKLLASESQFEATNQATPKRPPLIRHINRNPSNRVRPRWADALWQPVRNA